MDENKYVDDASPYETVNAAVATGAAAPTRTTILTYQVRNGLKCFLRAVRNTVSAGGESQIKFSVLINGVALYGFDRISNQIAAPENQQGNLLRRREIPQGATLSVVADNADTANEYAVTAKLEIGYESL